MCSKSFNFNPDLPEERGRLVLSMAPVDWAAEWLRPVTPNFKMVGPVLAGPGKALPANLEVNLCHDILVHIKPTLVTTHTMRPVNWQQSGYAYDANLKDGWACAGST